MIDVRLFAGLRQGRQKISRMEPDSGYPDQERSILYSAVGGI